MSQKPKLKFHIGTHSILARVVNNLTSSKFAQDLGVANIDAKSIRELLKSRRSSRITEQMHTIDHMLEKLGMQGRERYTASDHGFLCPKNAITSGQHLYDAADAAIEDLLHLSSDFDLELHLIISPILSHRANFDISRMPPDRFSWHHLVKKISDSIPHAALVVWDGDEIIPMSKNFIVDFLGIPRDSVVKAPIMNAILADLVREDSFSNKTTGSDLRDLVLDHQYDDDINVIKGLINVTVRQ